MLTKCVLLDTVEMVKETISTAGLTGRRANILSLCVAPRALTYTLVSHHATSQSEVPKPVTEWNADAQRTQSQHNTVCSTSK
jgi:hypothetical protein